MIQRRTLTGKNNCDKLPAFQMHQLSRVNERTQSTELSSINPAKLVAKRNLPDQGCQTLSQLMYFALLELAPAQFILLDLEA